MLLKKLSDGWHNPYFPKTLITLVSSVIIATGLIGYEVNNLASILDPLGSKLDSEITSMTETREVVEEIFIGVDFADTNDGKLYAYGRFAKEGSSHSSEYYDRAYWNEEDFRNNSQLRNLTKNHKYLLWLWRTKFDTTRPYVISSISPFKYDSTN